MKRKVVVNADESQLERVQHLVEEGRYRTVSEFMREAVDEKLERVERDRIADAVERYCAAGHAGEDNDLVEAQAFDTESAAPRQSQRARRASR
jgi:Arc/MetJ-type ribon-helix-helix transcriptional regulator